MDFSWSTCFICLLAIFPDSMGHKYLTVIKSLPGTIYIGTRSELIGKPVTANKVQNSFSPLLQVLQQDQFSFDMELCNLVAITRGSFVVADKDEPQSDVRTDVPEPGFEVIRLSYQYLDHSTSEKI
uniref:GIY-YIG domain-containing protein n=1 Tax=Magallana gigas TaxID=29159 RepID=A0A8W8ILC6_MAGGI